MENNTVIALAVGAGLVAGSAVKGLIEGNQRVRMAEATMNHELEMKKLETKK